MALFIYSYNSRNRLQSQATGGTSIVILALSVQQLLEDLKYDYELNKMAETFVLGQLDSRESDDTIVLYVYAKLSMKELRDKGC